METYEPKSPAEHIESIEATLRSINKNLMYLVTLIELGHHLTPFPPVKRQVVKIIQHRIVWIAQVPPDIAVKDTYIPVLQLAILY